MIELAVLLVVLAVVLGNRGLRTAMVTGFLYLLNFLLWSIVAVLVVCCGYVLWER